jgi:glycerol-3-phosphate dehydrogenase
VRRDLDALRDNPFDLLVLGGGITGAGVALDAALSGWRVAVIDKGDFASGTSSASSKLVHGGLRYLEHGAFRLVHEALHERRLLLRNAPHLVQPLRFVIPFYDGARVPPWKWRTGLTLYDLLAGSSNLRRSRPLSARRLRREFPGLRPAGLRGGAEYFDAQMDDARLCIEVMDTAAAEGACVANYVEARAFEQAGGRITGVCAVDRVGGDEFTIRARQVLNATGPWVDAVCRLAGDATGPHLRPTKGVHLVAPDRGLRAAFLLLHPADGRVFFVIPWNGGPRHLGDTDGDGPIRTLIGTTDTNWEGPPEAVGVVPNDIDYLLGAYNHYFAPPLVAGDLLGSFAGLRPLVRARPGEPSSLSREDRLFASPSGLLSIAGGKYTTYRHMAEVITQTVADRLRRRYRNRTRTFRLVGAPDEPWEDFAPTASAALRSRHRIRAAAARHLVNRYGRRAPEVAAYLDAEPKLGESAVPGEPDLRAEFPYQRDQEMALRAADHLLRRTRLGLFHPELLRRPPPELEAPGRRP